MYNGRRMWDFSHLISVELHADSRISFGPRSKSRRDSQSVLPSSSPSLAFEELHLCRKHASRGAMAAGSVCQLLKAGSWPPWQTCRSSCAPAAVVAFLLQ